MRHTLSHTACLASWSVSLLCSLAIAAPPAFGDDLPTLAPTQSSAPDRLSWERHTLRPPPFTDPATSNARTTDQKTGATRDADQDAVPGWRRGLAFGATLVPGALIHGAGHMAMGEHRTGLRLLAAEGLGLGLAVGGVTGLAATGASPRTVAPFTWMTVGGVGLFGLSALADLYGVLAPTGGTGAPLLRAPSLEADFGYQYVRNPIFGFRHLTVTGAHLRGRAWRLSPRVWLAPEANNWRLYVVGARRLLGARPDRRGLDGTALDLELGVVHHDYGDEGFVTTTGELSLSGRLDLRRVGPTLTGAFVDGSFGLALGATNYDGVGAEVAELLLARFALGLYLGHRADGYGELSLYYDHRHDGYVEGLKSSGVGSGAPGHFGASARFRVWRQWGVESTVEYGSALMVGLSLVFQMGGSR